MANKIDRFSPKIEIINHFDSLINRVDIDIENCIEKCKEEEQIRSQLEYFQFRRRNAMNSNDFYFLCFDYSYIEYQTVDEFSESTKVVDYLNQVRKRTIDELTKAQKDTLEYYKQNYSEFKSNDHQLIDENKIDEDSLEHLKLNSSKLKLNDNQLINEKKIDQIRSELFKDKFYFQVHYEPNKWIFNLFTFVTDFYMSPTDITLLEILIKSPYENVENYEQEFQNLFDSKFVFDEKKVLIGLLQKSFYDNLTTHKFPSHVISVQKQDTVKIKEIYCNSSFLKGVNLTSTTIDLSNLDELNFFVEDREKTVPKEIKIEGLCSLKSIYMMFKSLDQVILRNLFALIDLQLHLDTPINSEVLFKLTDYLPNIEILDLNADFSYFSLDSMYNLKTLKLDGKLLDDFNLQLFDNLCNQLEEIAISSSIIDKNCFEKLFYGRNFPYLIRLCISHTRIVKLEKEMFNGFRMVKNLGIYANKELRIIDHDAFSNLIKLEGLYLYENCIESIDKRHFSNLINLKSFTLSRNLFKAIEENAFSSLTNLQTLDLSYYQWISLDPKFFVGLKNLKKLDLRDIKLINFDLGILDNIPKIEEIDLSENEIINKDEIINRFSSSKIKFYI